MEVKRGHLHEHFRPFSVNVLIGYVIFLLAFYAFHLIYDLAGAPATVFFGKVFSGASAVLLDGASVLLLAFVLYGLLKRTAWAWQLAVIWFGISIANALLSLVLVKGGLLFVVRDLVLLSFFSVILIDGFVLWYVVYRKRYFEHKAVAFDSTDKFFVYVLATFWVLVILIALSFGMRYYKITTSKAEGIISELSGSDFESAMSICSAKSGFDGDLCYTAVSAMFPDKPKEQICSRVSTDFYRITCLKAI